MFIPERVPPKFVSNQGINKSENEIKTHSKQYEFQIQVIWITTQSLLTLCEKPFQQNPQDFYSQMFSAQELETKFSVSLKLTSKKLYYCTQTKDRTHNFSKLSGMLRKYTQHETSKEYWRLLPARKKPNQTKTKKPDLVLTLSYPNTCRTCFISIKIQCHPPCWPETQVQSSLTRCQPQAICP